VVETDVHYPTDLNLLYDALRKVITLTADYADHTHVIGWRQSQYNLRQVKSACRKAQPLKRSNARDETKKRQRDKRIAQAHQDAIDLCQRFITKSQATLAVTLPNLSLSDALLALQIEGFIQHAQRQMEQIDRRVLQEEKMPHAKKFSRCLSRIPNGSTKEKRVSPSSGVSRSACWKAVRDTFCIIR